MKKVVWAIFVFTLASGRGLAQKPQESWDNLSQLRVGEKVEVIGANLKSVKGTFLGFDEEKISLRANEGEVSISRGDVSRVSIRKRSKRARNALIGLSIGIGVGVGLGLATKEEHPLPVPLGLFLGATAAGAGIGAAFPSHPTIYRARKAERRAVP